MTLVEAIASQQVIALFPSDDHQFVGGVREVFLVLTRALTFRAGTCHPCAIEATFRFPEQLARGTTNMLWMCVAIRVLVNPLSNVFQKILTGRGVSPTVVVGATHALLALVSLPLLAIEPPPGTSLFWSSMAVSAVLAVAGNILLVKAMQMTDLSILGPVNSYKAVVSLVPGIVLLNEVPSWEALAGVGLIVAGSYFIADRNEVGSKRGVFGRLFGSRGVQYRIAALVLSAIEAVYLKRALLASSALPTFAVWSVAGFILLLPFLVRLVAAKTDTGWRPLRQVVPSYLLLGITTGLMQFSTIVIFGGFQVAAALALFQTSALVSVLLGWRVFRELDVVRRFVGSAIMVAGAVLIVTTR